ncbi:hypothetical protein ABIB68_007854 [Bradyrhizobium sp. F1.2.2]
MPGFAVCRMHKTVYGSCACAHETNRSKKWPGLSIRRLNDRSVFEKNRTAELIVEPRSHNIEILADAIAAQ